MDNVTIVDLHKIMYSDSGSEEEDESEEEAESDDDEGHFYEPEVKIEIKEEEPPGPGNCIGEESTASIPTDDFAEEPAVDTQTETKEEKSPEIFPEDNLINLPPPAPSQNEPTKLPWKKWYLEYDKLFSYHCTKCVQEDGSPLKLPSCQDMRIHFRREHKQTGYGFCSLCANRRIKHVHFQGHFQHHLHPDWTYPCMVCLKQFESRTKLKEHMRHHQAVQKERRKYHQISKTTACKSCNIAFESVAAYKHHINMSLQHNPMVVCDICGKSFRRNYYRSEHQFSHKAEELPCPDCGKIFPTRAAVYQHRRNIHSGNIYECKFCDYKTRHGTVIPKHLRAKHGINPDGSPYVAVLIDCPNCDKKLSDKKGLRAHMATHTDSRDHVCEYCSASFKTTSSYYSHRKSKHPVEWKMSKSL